MRPLLGALLGLGVAAGLALAAAALTGAALPTLPRGAISRRLPPALRLTARERLIAGAAVLVGVLLALTTGWLVAVILAPLLAVGVPRLLARPADHATTERIEAIEQWVRGLRGLLASDVPLTSALIATAQTAPAPIRPQVETLAARLQSRRPLVEALYAFADDLNDQTADFVATTLIEAAEADGAGLGRVLNAFAADVTDEVRGRRDILVQREEVRSQARWLTLLTVTGLPAFVLFTSYGAAYRNPVGELVLLGLAGAFTAALLWLRRRATFKPTPRFLVTPAAYATTPQASR